MIVSKLFLLFCMVAVSSALLKNGRRVASRAISQGLKKSVPQKVVRKPAANITKFTGTKAIQNLYRTNGKEAVGKAFPLTNHYNPTLRTTFYDVTAAKKAVKEAFKNGNKAYEDWQNFLTGGLLKNNLFGRTGPVGHNQFVLVQSPEYGVLRTKVSEIASKLCEQPAIKSILRKAAPFTAKGTTVGQTVSFAKEAGEKLRKSVHLTANWLQTLPEPWKTGVTTAFVVSYF